VERNIIFDSASFLPVFTADLLAAKREIVIVSPSLTRKHVLIMTDVLEKCILTGVKVTVITRPTGDYKEREVGRVSGLLSFLGNKDIAVVEKSKVHQKFAIIDGRIAWYGSIDLLSFGDAQESIMRLDSATVAGELLSVMRD
jgi:phosphatidylserine/phosphatidylglycerophosphate/cardiolipin synthase-like enzyme